MYEKRKTCPSVNTSATFSNISASPALNPFTPKSDQIQIFPAASPEILHHTVWRTWLFIPSSLTQMKYDYTTNSHYLAYTFLFKKLGECTICDGDVRLKHVSQHTLRLNERERICFTSYLRCSTRRVPVEAAVRLEYALLRSVLVKQPVALEWRGEASGLCGRLGRPTALEQRQQNKNDGRAIHGCSQQILRRKITYYLVEQSLNNIQILTRKILTVRSRRTPLRASFKLTRLRTVRYGVFALLQHNFFFWCILFNSCAGELGGIDWFRNSILREVWVKSKTRLRGGKSRWSTIFHIL